MTTTATRIVTAALLGAASLAVTSTLPAGAAPDAPSAPTAPAGSCSGGSSGTGENGSGQIICPLPRPPVRPGGDGGNDGGGDSGGNGGSDGGGDDGGCPDPETLPDNMACDELEAPIEDGPAAPQPPPPGEVAQRVLLRAVTNFARPEPVTDPPMGSPSLLDVPTFVAVDNWRGPVTAAGCDEETGTVCVTLTATPQLHFDPGEPGAATLACDGGGTRFEPGGAPPRQQAEGACAHTYTQRTATGGRPERWPGEVRVTWSFVWTLDAGGLDGTLPPVTLSNDVPRAVREVQSVGRAP